MLGKRCRQLVMKRQKKGIEAYREEKRKLKRCIIQSKKKEDKRERTSE